jgi:Domain of unknown function (DUF6378)
MTFDPDNTCLDKAKALVMGDRQDDYGHPYDDFTKVTKAAKALGIDPANKGPLHHSLYMVLVKIARLVETPDHADSVVDGPGYFLTYERCLDRERPIEVHKVQDDPWARNADLLVELAHADDSAARVYLHQLYDANPTRWEAEVAPTLPLDVAKSIRGG